VTIIIIVSIGGLLLLDIYTSYTECITTEVWGMLWFHQVVISFIRWHGDFNPKQRYTTWL